MPDQKLYEVSLQDGYIRTKIWGDAGADAFEDSTAEVMSLHDTSHVNVLLCDISELKPDKVNIAAQTRGMGALWKLRAFDKVAFLLGNARITSLLHGSLEALHLTNTFQSFDNEAEAVAWLKAAADPLKR